MLQTLKDMAMVPDVPTVESFDHYRIASPGGSHSFMADNLSRSPVFDICSADVDTLCTQSRLLHSFWKASGIFDAGEIGVDSLG